MRPNRILNILTVVLIGGLFIFQIGLQLSGKDIFNSEMENRAKAKFSGLSFHLHAIRDFEYFYRDHFALRDGLIHLSAVLDYAAFHVSPVTKVILGSENWLYYNEGWNIESYRNEAPFSDDELKKRVSFHESVAEALRARGVQYIYVIAPNNQTIYPEYLPAWAKKQLNPRSRYDQLLGAFQESGIVNTIDLRQALLEEKPHHRVFYNTNTHWNKFGGYIAYKSILNAVAARSGDSRFAPVSGESVQISEDPKPPRGDLLNMINLSNDWVPETGAMTVFLKPQMRTSLRVASFYDSFYGAMQDYFSTQFQVTLNGKWKEFDKNGPDDLASQADLVIFEQVERSLYETEYR